MSNNLNEKWLDVCNKVCSYSDVNIPQFKAYIDRIIPQAMSEGFLLVTVQSDFMKKRIEQDFKPVIGRALQDLYEVPFMVEIDIDPAQDSLGTSVSQSLDANNMQPQQAPSGNMHAEGTSTPGAAMQEEGENVNLDGITAHAEEPTSAPAQKPDIEQEMEMGHAVEKRSNTFSTLTFENFVIGESNRMAYSMAVQVAEIPGSNLFNPLFIHGKSGLGKTHLMRAIQNYINETRPELDTVYADSEELVNSYTEASLTKDINKSSYNNFKRPYQEADILLIDDVQFFQGKTGTLDIFFQIFNKLISQNKQIVLSADRAPKNIDVEERYKTRFMQGSVIDIQPPEVETKLAIVKSYINEYKSTYPILDFSVPEDVQMYIAENSGSNIRVLKGAVNKVVYTITIEKRESITIEEVRSLLENHFSQGISRNVTIEDIQREVEGYFKIKHSDMIGNGRSREVVFPRQIAMYLCKRMLDSTFNNIAKKFNRDHTTAMHSIAKIESMMLSNRDLQEQIEALEKMINEL